MVLWFVVALACAFSAGGSVGADEYPPLVGYVNDHVDILLRADQAKLEHELFEFQERFGIEIFVVALEDAAGQNPQEYAAVLIKAWNARFDSNSAYIFFFRKESVLESLGVIRDGDPLWAFCHSPAMKRLEKHRNILLSQGRLPEALFVFTRGLMKGLEDEIKLRDKTENP